MERLEGKAALIAGAARAIGLAFAETYIREGARVEIGDISIHRARESAAALGEACVAIEMDVTRQDSIDASVDAAKEHLGGIDILINNAALFSAAPIVEIDRENYEKVWAVNFTGALFTLQAVAKKMIARGKAEDLTGMAVFRATDEAEYIVLRTYNVDGGQWLS